MKFKPGTYHIIDIKVTDRYSFSVQDNDNKTYQIEDFRQNLKTNRIKLGQHNSFQVNSVGQKTLFLTKETISIIQDDQIKFEENRMAYRYIIGKGIAYIAFALGCLSTLFLKNPVYVILGLITELVFQRIGEAGWRSAGYLYRFRERYKIADNAKKQSLLEYINADRWNILSVDQQDGQYNLIVQSINGLIEVVKTSDEDDRHIILHGNENRYYARSDTDVRVLVVAD